MNEDHSVLAFSYGLVLGKKTGGGGDVTVESFTATDNGTYAAPSGKAYSPVIVSVPTASGVNF